MRICAHINHGPFQNGRKRFDSIREAVEYFRAEVLDNYYTPGPDALSEEERDGLYIMDIYPELDDDGKPCECDDAMNFHDYPMRRYGMGPRGGLRMIST